MHRSYITLFLVRRWHFRRCIIKFEDITATFLGVRLLNWSIHMILSWNRSWRWSWWTINQACFMLSWHDGIICAYGYRCSLLVEVYSWFGPLSLGIPLKKQGQKQYFQIYKIVTLLQQQTKWIYRLVYVENVDYEKKQKT